MESLSCDEVWLKNPDDAELDHAFENKISTSKSHIVGSDSFLFADEDGEDDSFVILLDKESRYMPETGYLTLVKSNSMIRRARFIAVKWFIKSQNRLNLSLGTVFIAVNYLDRFISINRCKGWKCWMFDLLSIACLSIACKFNETITTISLHDFQGDKLDHSFDSRMVTRMELKLLKALDWKMASATSFSYVDLILQQSIDNEIKETLVQDSSKRVAELLLLRAVLDSEFLRFQPCVMAMSAVKCVSEDSAPPPWKCYAWIKHLESLMTQDQQDDMIQCQKLMQDHALKCKNPWCGSSSPISVLKFDLVGLYDDDQWSLICMKSSRKRKREGRTCCVGSVH